MNVVSIELPAAPRAPARERVSKKRRVVWIVVYSLAALILGVYATDILWKASGSNRWELETVRNGVSIYSLKAPGSSLKQFKAVMRAHYSLNQLIAGLIENSNMEVCRKFIPACIDVQVVEPWSSRTLSDTVMWTLRLPAPLAPREVILQSQVAQDPVTRQIVVDILAAPNKLPRHPGKVRVTHIQNRWVYTPLGNGEVQIEFLQDADMGGLLPDELENLGGVNGTYQFIHDQLPALLDNDKLRQTHYDFIKE